MNGGKRMRKKILITGGSGFIGSFLVEALIRKGYEVTIFDIDEPKFTPNVPFVKEDITNREAVFNACKGFDVIFHYAGMLGTHETVERAYETARINILGTLNIFDAARKYGAMVYYATKPNYWRNPYTITKITAEEFGLMYRDEFQVPVVLLRYFNVYGPRQKTDIFQKAVPTFIIRALKNKPLEIYGDGTQGTDHIYVEDAIEATVRLFESELMPESAVEIGSGIEITVNEIAEKIIQLTGSKSKIIHVPMRRGEVEHTRIQADPSYLRKFLNFKPKYSFEEGLLRTIEYYKKIIE